MNTLMDYEITLTATTGVHGLTTAEFDISMSQIKHIFNLCSNAEEEQEKRNQTEACCRVDVSSDFFDLNNKGHYNYKRNTIFVVETMDEIREKKQQAKLEALELLRKHKISIF